MRVRLRSYSSDSSGSGYYTALRTIVEEREVDAEPWPTKKPLNSETSGVKTKKKWTSLNGNEKAYQEKSSEKAESLYAIPYQCHQENNLFFHSSSEKDSRESRGKDTLSSRDLASKLFPEFFAVQRENEETNVDVKCAKALKTVSDPLVESWLGFYGRIN